MGTQRRIVGPRPRFGVVGRVDRQSYEAMMKHATLGHPRLRDRRRRPGTTDDREHGDPRLHRARTADRQRGAGDDRRRRRVNLGAPRRPMAVRAAYRVDRPRSVWQGPHEQLALRATVWPVVTAPMWFELACGTEVRARPRFRSLPAGSARQTSV